jgi:hypothetical protein
LELVCRNSLITHLTGINKIFEKKFENPLAMRELLSAQISKRTFSIFFSMETDDLCEIFKKIFQHYIEVNPETLFGLLPQVKEKLDPLNEKSYPTNNMAKHILFDLIKLVEPKKENPFFLMFKIPILLNYVRSYLKNDPITALEFLSDAKFSAKKYPSFLCSKFILLEAEISLNAAFKTVEDFPILHFSLAKFQAKKDPQVAFKIIDNFIKNDASLDDNEKTSKLFYYLPCLQCISYQEALALSKHLKLPNDQLKFLSQLLGVLENWETIECILKEVPPKLKLVDDDKLYEQFVIHKKTVELQKIILNSNSKNKNETKIFSLQSKEAVKKIIEFAEDIDEDYESSDGWETERTKFLLKVSSLLDAVDHDEAKFAISLIKNVFTKFKSNCQLIRSQIKFDREWTAQTLKDAREFFWKERENGELDEIEEDLHTIAELQLEFLSEKEALETIDLLEQLGSIDLSDEMDSINEMNSMDGVSRPSKAYRYIKLYNIKAHIKRDEFDLALTAALEENDPSLSAHFLCYLAKESPSASHFKVILAHLCKLKLSKEDEIEWLLMMLYIINDKQLSSSLASFEI